MRLQIAGDAGDGAARTDAGDEGVDLALHLLEDFGTRRLEVSLRVGVVGELVDEVAARNLLGQALGHVGIVFGVAVRHVRTGQAHIGAHGAQVLDLLLRHLVGDDQQDVIALLLADQGQGQTGVARRRLDDGAARLQPARVFSRLDHRQGDAVLDRAAGVLALQLQEQAAGAGVDPRHLDHRRLADQVQQRAHGAGQDGGVGHRHAKRLRKRRVQGRKLGVAGFAVNSRKFSPICPEAHYIGRNDQDAETPRRGPARQRHPDRLPA
ncbi:hypothetical protein D3C80_1112300 [compost metagenome]